MRNKTLRRLLRNKFFVIGFTLSMIIIVVSLIAPYIVVYDPELPELANRLAKPDWFSKGWSGHILGCDAMGQDIFTRLLIGSRYSLVIAFASVFLACIIGIVIGMLAGYYGGWLDELLMRFGDIQLSIPVMILAICIVAILGSDVKNLIIVMVFCNWVQYARVIRSNVMIAKGQEYISASRVLGASDFWIMTRQIFPNVLNSVIILCSQQIGYTILLESSMSFLGLGVQPPTPSWGMMIAESRSYMQLAPWTVLAPGFALMATAIAFNFMGDGLRDALDPKMKA